MQVIGFTLAEIEEYLRFAPAGQVMVKACAASLP
jgi:hypothetical protein